MAERLAYLEAVVGADVTAFRRGMTEVRKDIGVLSEDVNGLARSARNATFAFTVPMATVGTFAVQASSDFEASLRNINSIALVSEDAFASLTDRVLEFGSTVRGGPQAAADALYEVYSAGVYGEEAFEIMTASVMTAEAGLADLQTTTKALTATMQAYSKYGYDAERVSDALTRTVQVGVGEMGEFATNMGRVAPLAAALNIEVEELGANWAFITQRGASAGTAATELYGVMSKLLKPTEDLEAAFGRLGVASGQELIEEFGGMQGALLALYETFDESEVKMGQAFSNERAIRGLLKIINDVPAWNAAIDEFNTNLDEATESAWDQQMMTFAASVDLLTSAAKSAAIVIGDQFTPLLKPLIDSTTEFVLKIHDVNPAVIGMATAVTVAAAALPPLVWLLTGMANPIGAAVIGLTALGTAFATNLGGSRDLVQRWVQDITNPLTQLGDLWTDFMGMVFPEDPAASFEEAFTNAVTELIPVGASDIFTIKPGDTFWGIWSEHFSETMTWDQFKAANDVTQLLIPLEELVVFTGDTVQAPQTSITPNQEYMMEGLVSPTAMTNEARDSLMAMGGDAGTLVNPVYARITAALDTLAPRIKEYVLFTVAPSESEAVGSVFGNTLKSGLNTLAAGASLLDNLDFGAGSQAFGEIMRTQVLIPMKAGFMGAINASDWVDVGRVLLGKAGEVWEPLKNLGVKFLAWSTTTLLPNLLQYSVRAASVVGLAVGMGLAGLGARAWNHLSSLTSDDFFASEGSVRAFFTDNVVAPIEAGFRQAIGDLGLDTEFAVMGNILNILGDFVIPESLSEDIKAIGESLASFWNDVQNVHWGEVGVGLLAVGVGLARFFVALSLGAAVGVADFLEAIGNNLEQFGYVINDLRDGDVMGALTNLGIGLLDLGLALVVFPLNLLYSIWSSLGEIVGVDLPSVTDGLQELVDELRGIVSEPEVVGELTVEQRLAMDEGVPLVGGEWGGGLEAPTYDMIAEITPSVVLGPQEGADTLIDPALEAWAVGVAGGESYNVPLPGNIQATPPGIEVDITPETPVTLTGTPDDMAASLSPEVQDQIAAIQVTGMTDALTNYLAENPEEGAQGFIDNFLTPIEDAFITTFGEESSALAAYQAFATGLAASSGEIDTDFTNLALGVDVAMTAIVGSVSNNLLTLIAEFDQASEAIARFEGGMKRLAELDASIKADINVSGSITLNGNEVDGARAAGGGVRQGGTYLVGEQGPELFSPGVSGYIHNSRDTQGMGGGTTNYITIDGTGTNVTELIEDLEREGIYLRG